MSARALKRRRLNADDITVNSSDAAPAPIKNTEQKSQDVLHEDKHHAFSQARSSPAANRVSASSKSTLSNIKDGQHAVVSEVQSSPAPRTAMDIWREAKIKSQGYRRRMTKEQPKDKVVVDVYDDFEGAHTVPETHGRMTKGAKRGTKTVARERTRGRGRKALGSAAEREHVQTETGVEEAPKRTFEDEIIELEEVAKRQAEEEEKEDGSEDAIAVNHGSGRRSSSRKSKPSKKMEMLVNGHATASNLVNGVTKPLDRRKTKAVVLPEDELDSLHDEDVHHESASAAQDMEMTDSTTLISTPKTTETQQAVTEDTIRAGIPDTIRTAEKAKATTTKLSANNFAPQELQLIQSIVLGKATGRRPMPLVNLDAEYAKVSAIVSQTVTAGESNSILLIGARGCGKSALVNRIIREQTAQHPNDFHTVRLSGFIHTDDKIALREIWRQLGREMDSEDGTAMKNYADILNSLLALLSHPAETGRDQEGQVTKSVIFVIDEFDHFAHHPRQTLLYNLFDIAQSRKAPIAVLGLTTKIDVAESLEKRVKSRFSHRYVHLSLAKSFQAYEETCKAAVAIAASELTAPEKAQSHVTTDISSKSHDAQYPSSSSSSSSLTRWNELVDHIFALDSVETHLRRLYYTTKSVPQFITSISYPTATLPIADGPNTAVDILAHFDATFTPSLAPPDSKLDLLPSLSMLQLGLLVCAARLAAIHDVETVSFALAYDEYKALASKVKLQASASGAIAQGAGSRVWGRGVAQGAWEGLVGCGLVLPDGRSGGAGRIDVGLEEIGMSGVELGVWGRWCREI